MIILDFIYTPASRTELPFAWHCTVAPLMVHFVMFFVLHPLRLILVARGVARLIRRTTLLALVLVLVVVELAE